MLLLENTVFILHTEREIELSHHPNNYVVHSLEFPSFPSFVFKTSHFVNNILHASLSRFLYAIPNMVVILFITRD